VGKLQNKILPLTANPLQNDQENQENQTMTLTTKQLRQISDLCKKMNNSIDGIYDMEASDDAAMIIASIEIRTRNTKKLLGHLIKAKGLYYLTKKEGYKDYYVFKPNCGKE